MIRGNLHTHTTFCDGKNTPREIVETAIEKGFSYIGFSGHGHTFFDESYCMREEKKYIAEVRSLKEEYKDKIEILCGVERDFLSDDFENTFDYEIASVHYIKAGGKLYDVDNSIAVQKECIKNHFGNDPYSYAEEYYKSVALLNGDIIGHFDLLTKFDRANEIFNPKEERYKKAALSALFSLIEKGCAFEVNTGAMARGYKDAPYPDLWLLEEIKKKGARVVITSDCHRREFLDYGYDFACEILTKLGFKELFNIEFIRNEEKQ